MKKHLLILSIFLFSAIICELPPQMKIPQSAHAQEGEPEAVVTKKSILGSYVVPGFNYSGAAIAAIKAMFNLGMFTITASQYSTGNTAYSHQSGPLFLVTLAMSAETLNHVVSAQPDNSPVINKTLIVSNLAFAAFNAGLAIYLPCPITWLFTGINGTIQLGTAAYKYATIKPVE
jgi:hypothetical protein